MFNRVRIIFIVLIIWFFIERFIVPLTGLAEPILYLSIILFFLVNTVIALKENSDYIERVKILLMSAFLLTISLLAFIFSIQTLLS
ncbi:hypothetical protein MKX54_10860 [Alkalihalobacillus sp. FSL R5-0424]